MSRHTKRVHHHTYLFESKHVNCLAAVYRTVSGKTYSVYLIIDIFNGDTKHLKTVRLPPKTFSGIGARHFAERYAKKEVKSVGTYYEELAPNSPLVLKSQED